MQKDKAKDSEALRMTALLVEEDNWDLSDYGDYDLGDDDPPLDTNTEFPSVTSSSSPIVSSSGYPILHPKFLGHPKPFPVFLKHQNLEAATGELCGGLELDKVDINVDMALKVTVLETIMVPVLVLEPIIIIILEALERVMELWTS